MISTRTQLLAAFLDGYALVSCESWWMRRHHWDAEPDWLGPVDPALVQEGFRRGWFDHQGTDDDGIGVWSRGRGLEEERPDGTEVEASEPDERRGPAG